MNSLETLHIITEASLDKKATRIITLDVTGLSDVCDYQFICSGKNEMQTKAIAQSIQGSLKKDHDLRVNKIEGLTSGHWILMDYGSINIHVFYEPLRDYYAIESIWQDAKFLNTQNATANS